MKNLTIKIKDVFLPFLLVSIGTILFYNLFRWLFDIKLGILHLKEDLLNYWIPFILPWIPITIWLRRRIRVLNVEGKNGNGYFIYQFAMAIALSIPLMISQSYIELKSYDLIELDSIGIVNLFEKEKYFKIISFDVKEDIRLPYVTGRTSGRNNEDLTFHLYLSCQFENSDNVWYGVEYKRRISNRKNDTEKNIEYRKFWENSIQNFESYDFQKVEYFKKLGYSDERDGFLEALKESNPLIKEKEQIILVPVKESFDQRLGNKLYLILSSFGIGSLIILLMVIFPKINQKELNDFKKNKPLKDDDLKSILEFLDPRGPNKATSILILLNILVFIIMVLSGINIISPTPKELLEIGGNRRLEVLNGEYWRLFTSMFIHGGFAHLLMNLVGLGFSGILAVSVLGNIRMLISYVICGLFASLTSIYWHDNTVSVGASGAIFGLYGLILAFTLFRIYPKSMHRLNWIVLGLFAGVSLLYGLVGGIDNSAHIGGLISGFIIGVIFILTDKKRLLKNLE